MLAPWAQLKAALSAPADVARLTEVNALAELVVLQADRLVNNLETSGLATRLHVINVSGRQRMLSQRLAKAALLSVALSGDAAAAANAEAAQARSAFEEGLAYLNAVPLSTRISKGFYREGIWSDTGFMPWEQISAVSWREENAITLVLISRLRKIARRLQVRAA